MRRFTVPLLVVVLGLLLTGCFKHTYQVGAGAPEGEVVYKHWHHHWLFGLIRPELQKTLDLNKFCPSGDATIHEEQSFVNGLINVLVGIIYSPTTVTIRCGDGSQARIELSEEQVAGLVRDPLFPLIVDQVVPERLDEVNLALAAPARSPERSALIASAE